MASSYKSIRDIDWPLLLITLSDLGRGNPADLQRDARDRVARCLVEADCLDRRRISDLLAGEPDRLPHAAWAGVLSCTVWRLRRLVGIFFIGTVVFGSRRWIPIPGGFQFAGLGVRQDGAGTAGSAVSDRPAKRTISIGATCSRLRGWSEFP